MRADYFNNKKRIFEFINEFPSAIFLKLKISNIQLDFIAYIIIRFKLIISIREFRLSDLSENHLIIIKFINFGHFNNEDVSEGSI